MAVLCTAFLLLAAADASAAIRYAAPGGNNDLGSECRQGNPCSLFNAASRVAPSSTLNSGDEVVVEPGSYSGIADLGPEEVILAEEAANIHGVAGEPLPVITIHGGGGDPGFFMDAEHATLSHVEIVSSEDNPGFTLLDSATVDGVVARSGGGFVACEASAGLIRNSACLSSGSGGTALMAFDLRAGNSVELRNVTAIATGTNSIGLNALARGTHEVSVDGIGVLARGTFKDVLAETVSAPPTGAGPKAAISLDHSDFATSEAKTENGGIASVPEPGTGTNITAAPLLAADGYHELLGSPTIDAGAADPSSGAVDIDGEQRVFGGSADIGADELQIATTTSISCAPATQRAGSPTTCTATVASAAGAPAGVVKLASGGPGALTSGSSCSLSATGSAQASCHLAYVPSAVGPGAHKLTASYQGDAIHRASEGSTAVQVLAARPAAPDTSLRKKPARKTASRSATFTFASDQAGSHFECKLDKKAFKRCRSPFKAKKLKPGRHSFSVRAVNGAGIADPTPTIFRWKVS